MTRLYSSEKGKLGSNVGFIYPFITPLPSDDPDDPTVRRLLPAGFLKCDGKVYDADVFPALAGILGVGAACKFKGDRTLLEDKFRTPDLGAKVIMASQSDIGIVNNSTVESSSGSTIKKAGVGVTIDNNTGSVAEIGYTGFLQVPAKSVDLQGNPGWAVPRNTDTEGVNSLQVQPHGHYSTTVRLRHSNDPDGSFGNVYSNSWNQRFGNMLGGDGKYFDKNIQVPLIVGGKNIDITTDVAGNDANTEHAHQIFFTPGVNHTTTSSGWLHTYKADMSATLVRPDGIVSSAQLKSSGAYKFDDVISPFILVQYLIKF